MVWGGLRETNIWDKLCILSHVFAGFLSCLAVVIDPVLTIVGFLVFSIYEINQQIHKHDFLDEEFMEFGIGFFFGVILLIIWMVVV